MPYFDHIQCPSCRQRLDPEQLSSAAGLACPLCGVALTPTALFGLSDAFSEPDEIGPRSLDDLIPGPVTAAGAGRPIASGRSAPAPTRSAPSEAPKGGALAALQDLKRRK